VENIGSRFTSMGNLGEIWPGIFTEKFTLMNIQISLCRRNKTLPMKEHRVLPTCLLVS